MCMGCGGGKSSSGSRGGRTPARSNPFATKGSRSTKGGAFRPSGKTSGGSYGAPKVRFSGRRSS